MKNAVQRLIIFVLAALLAAGPLLPGAVHAEETAAAVEPAAAAEAATPGPTAEPTPESTAEPTPAPTPVPTA